MKTQATSSSEKKKKSLGLNSASHHPLPWDSHMKALTFPHGEIWRKQRNLQLSAFLSFVKGSSFPSSALSVIVQQYTSQMQLPWKKKKNNMFVLSYCWDEPGLTPGCRCALFPWVFVLTVIPQSVFVDGQEEESVICTRRYIVGTFLVQVLSSFCMFIDS